MPGSNYNYDAGGGNSETSNNGGGSNASSNSTAGGPQNGETDECRRPPFTVHGVLHFLKYEWSRYEMERNEWEMERAELRARISFLVGERKAQENLKRDLVRRIKMLEYSLKQERAHVYRLTHNGQDPAGEDTDEYVSPAVSSNVPMDVDAIEKGTLNSQTWNEARQVLRQFLQEIGYSEKILDVRSFRVKNLLGQLPDNGINNGSGEGRKAAEKALHESEQAILETADLIKKSRGQGTEVVGGDGERLEYAVGNDRFFDFDEDEPENNYELPPDSDDEEEKNFDSEVLDALDEFAFLEQKDVGGKQPANSGTATSQTHTRQLMEEANKCIGSFKKSRSSDVNEESFADGEMAGTRTSASRGPPTNLSVDSALGVPSVDAYDIVDIKDDFAMAEEDSLLASQRWNIRFTLRSHYDSIRAMQFHPVEPVLITASEDGTAKLWDLGSAFATRSSDGKAHNQPTTGIIDMEPIYTFRGHRGPILTMDMSPTGDMCYTGGYDGSICCYVVPSSKTEVYHIYDSSVLQTRLTGHTDCVWALAYHSSANRLISASADSTIRLWEAEVAEGMQNLVKTFVAPTAADGVTPFRPRSIDIVSTEPQQLLTAYSNAHCSILDLETGRNVLSFDLNNGNGDSVGEINKIISHPTMPVTVTAGEDRKIRVFDNNTGKLIDTVIAHVEGISTLAIDPNGLYLLSGSHDGSLRLWNMEKRICLQEIAAHRKKYNMSVMAVAFHPSRPLIASAGADSLTKVFTPSENGIGNTKYAPPVQFPVSSPPQAASSPPIKSKQQNPSPSLSTTKSPSSTSGGCVSSLRTEH